VGFGLTDWNPSYRLKILNLTVRDMFQKIKIYTIEYFQELGELLWHNKTRLLSVFLILIIFVPAFLVPPKEKNLIKTAEQTANNLPSLPSIPSLPSFSMPGFSPQDLVPKTPLINIEIPQAGYAQNLQPKNSPFLSGVLDQRIDTIIPDTDKVKDILKVVKKVRYEGKVSWGENLKNNVYADKFNGGSSVKITHDNKSFIKDIDEKIIMSDDNLLLVSKSVFEEIGGNPKTQKSINIVVEQ
jgi:hypothetical protein